MYKLVITEEADRDLDRIVNYIVAELKNIKAATDFLDEVAKFYDRLADTPKMYALCDDSEFSLKGYRKALIKNYLAVFSINEDTEEVIILRFFHSTMNYYRLL